VILKTAANRISGGCTAGSEGKEKGQQMKKLIDCHTLQFSFFVPLLPVSPELDLVMRSESRQHFLVNPEGAEQRRDR
jgi:hypothetical protein